MSEVEKLYRNTELLYCNKCMHDSELDCIYMCENKYSPFTADKQLEIVKFMLHKGIYYDTDGDSYWFHLTDDIENANYKSLDEAIAEFINLIWQDITEEEKEQIRTILES